MTWLNTKWFSLQSAARHRPLLLRLSVVVLAMFAFAFLLVPLYRAICEITGVNVLTRQELLGVQSAPKNSQVDLTRTVQVMFDANIQGPWHFTPKQRQVAVHPGEIVTVEYDIQNQLDRPVQGQAIPSYLPMQAAAHFKKLECFCFRQQPFAPKEIRTLPVVFVVDSGLPKDVQTVTLSYTFFEVGPPMAAAQ